MQLSFKSAVFALVSGLLINMGCSGEIGTTSADVSSDDNPTVRPGTATATRPPSVAPPAAPSTTVPPTTVPPATVPPSTTTPPNGSPSTVTPPSTPTTMTTPATAAAGTIVPLYTPPSHASWNAIVAAKMAHPRVRVIAVVNPANGPGPSKSADYAAGITRLATAGIQVIGYVSTDYARRAEATVKADIVTWKKFYPDLQGIFFDEQSNKPGYEALYKGYSQHAKQMGLPFTVGNPGTDTAESYIGTLDTMLIYESRGVSDVTALAGWHAKYPAANFGVIPYGTAMNLDYVRMARGHVGFVYLNNDELPNPWDSLPPYFGELLAALE